MKIHSAPIMAKMIELGLTRQVVCARAEVARDTLRKIERGEEISSLKTVKKLCLCLGIKPMEVIVDAATSAPAPGAQDLGDSPGAQADQHRHNKTGAR